MKMGQEEWNEGGEAIELSYDAITLTLSKTAEYDRRYGSRRSFSLVQMFIRRLLVDFYHFPTPMLAQLCLSFARHFFKSLFFSEGGTSAAAINNIIKILIT